MQRGCTTRVVQREQDKQRFSAPDPPPPPPPLSARPFPSSNLLIVTSAAGNVIKIPFSDGLPLCHKSATPTTGGGAKSTDALDGRERWPRMREREKGRDEGVRGGGRRRRTDATG